MISAELFSDRRLEWKSGFFRIFARSAPYATNHFQSGHLFSLKTRLVDCCADLGELLVSVVGGIVPKAIPVASWLEAILVVGLLMGMDRLMLWVLYGTGYTITFDQLLIRCGPFSFQVALQNIGSITPTRNPWSSPVCSLDRLKVVYGYSRQSIMICPLDKSGFLNMIVQKCPILVLGQDRVFKKENVLSAAASSPTVHL